MANFGDLVQKAFYLGIGAASYAIERAGGSMGELRLQVQKLADEMVARGEITAEEAKGLVEDMLKRAQQQASSPASSAPDSPPASPRRIEILEDDDPTPPTATTSPTATPQSSAQPPAQPSAQSSAQPSVAELRQQLEQLQAELKRLKRD